jgi:hypothetical protein
MRSLDRVPLTIHYGVGEQRVGNQQQMVRPPAIQNLILQARYGSQNNSRVIPVTHCSIFMEPAEYKRNISVSLIEWYDRT